MARTAVIIVAGGSGTRMGGDLPKQFMPLNGKEVLVWTVERFIDALRDPEIVVALPESEIERWGAIAAKRRLVGKHRICAGGGTRYESVKNGIAALSDSRCDLIAVHDGVRPLLSEKMILRCVETARKYGTAIPVVEPVDSFRVEEYGTFKIIDRLSLRAVQTPQVFDADILRRAYEQPYSPAFTDDASVVEKNGTSLSFCEGEHRNIKITRHDDLLFAGAVIEEERRK